MRAPLFPVSIAFLLGLIAASFFKPTPAMLRLIQILAITNVVLFFACFKYNLASHVILYALIFITGFLRFAAYNELLSNHIKFYITERQKKITVKGVVSSNPIFSRRFNYYPELAFLLKINDIYTDSSSSKNTSGWTAVSGLVLVKSYFSGKTILKYGDNVILSGDIAMPETDESGGKFNYGLYLSRQKIYAVLKVGKGDIMERAGSSLRPMAHIRRFLYSVKNKAKDIISLNLPPPHSDILQAMLLGDRHRLDKSVKELFIKTGTMHILAISGLHVGMIVIIFLALFKMLGIQWKVSYLLTVALIILYALMVGQRSSVWRATVMSVVFLFAFILEKRADILNTLSLSLLLLTTANPNRIFDAGFVLSFICVASIIWIFPFFNFLYKPKTKTLPLKLKFYALKIVAISIAIWVGVLPIIAYFFHIITPITVIANLIAVPFCFMLVALGMTALVVSVILPPLSVYFYECIWLADSIMLGVLRFLSRLPGAFIEVRSFSSFYIFLYYALLVLLLIYVRKKIVTFP